MDSVSKATLRRAARVHKKEFCEDCGGRVLKVEVHHIDGDFKNNAPGNLRSLCKFCHSRTHKEQGGRGRPKKPADQLYSARADLVMRPEVKARLQALATAAGETLSAYLVRNGLKGP